MVCQTVLITSFSSLISVSMHLFFIAQFSWKLLHPTDNSIDKACPKEAEEYERVRQKGRKIGKFSSNFPLEWLHCLWYSMCCLGRCLAFKLSLCRPSAITTHLKRSVPWAKSWPWSKECRRWCRASRRKCMTPAVGTCMTNSRTWCRFSSGNRYARPPRIRRRSFAGVDGAYGPLPALSVRVVNHSFLFHSTLTAVRLIASHLAENFNPNEDPLMTKLKKDSQTGFKVPLNKKSTPPSVTQVHANNLSYLCQSLGIFKSILFLLSSIWYAPCWNQ